MKSFITLIFVLFFFATLNAQQQIIPQKQIYQSLDGKIYVNKALPLYIKISESRAPNSQHIPLISEGNEKITPVFLAREGLNIFYSPTAVDTTTKKVAKPEQNVVFEVYADRKQPITKINNNITSYEKSDTLFFGKDLKVWFTSTDNLSGINKTYISVNKQPFEEYLHDTLTFEHGNYYTLQYYSTDNTGNCENIQTASFAIDTARPITNLVVIGTHINNIVASSCKVSLKPADAFSGTAKTFYYIDDQPKKIYTEPISISLFNEGWHVLKYYSQDKVLNTENEKSFEFYIDKTPPMIVDEVIGDFIYVNGQAYTSGRSQIQLSAIDNKAGVKDVHYSFDGKNWTLYQKPFFLPTDKPNIKIFFYSEDNVGNKTTTNTDNQSSIKLFSSQLDLTPPDIKIKYSGPQLNIYDTTYISGNTTIILSAYDDQAGLKNITYQIDQTNDTEFEKGFRLIQPGKHVITAFAYDNVNNVADVDFTVKVDTSGPEIFVHTSFSNFNIKNQNVLPKGTKIYIGATDNATGVEKITYQLNTLPETLYTNYLTINEQGKYEIIIKAYDLLQNITIYKFMFEIR